MKERVKKERKAGGKKGGEKVMEGDERLLWKSVEGRDLV